MKVYNTLTRRKEDFVPLEEGKVKMYVCGPTVYDYIHIGNGRPLVTFDTLRRYLIYRGYKVTYVQNFTDIDDKIIKKAVAEGVSSTEISERYINEALNDAKGLNVMAPDYAPQVTQEIPEIIQMISQLIEKGFAYTTDKGVYFGARSYSQYGKLSHRDLDDLEVGARVEVDESKQDPMDFILWKPKKDNEPFWESPWGDGRPGWHIECSVMAKKYLGEEIDIHAGGEDLVFPHHENEIAQSEAANGKPFAKYWLHNAFINVDNQKMAKSKGNFFTVRDIVAKFPYEVIRFYILSVHYRSPINFSHDILQASQNGLERIKTCVSLLEEKVEGNADTPLSDDEKAVIENSKKYVNDFNAKMDDDFNTADAITAIFELVTLANKNVTEVSSKTLAKEILSTIETLSGVLGIEFKKETGHMDTAEIERLIAERTQAKQAKDFKRADDIRGYLAEQGIILEDTKTGVRYSYKGNSAL